MNLGRNSQIATVHNHATIQQLTTEITINDGFAD
jgi:hypothetical protein